MVCAGVSERMVADGERMSARTRAVFRRRRFAAALAVAGLVAVLHGAVAGAKATRGAGPVVVVVVSGQTLWALGRLYAPQNTDLRRWVFEVQNMNGLKTGAVVAGQSLRLPAS